jgi:hypothetical protein
MDHSLETDQAGSEGRRYLDIKVHIEFYTFQNSVNENALPIQQRLYQRNHTDTLLYSITEGNHMGDCS